MFYAVFAILLAAVSTIHVRADTTPITPGPGAVFIEGQTCSTSWEVDPSGLWTSTVIELMTGDNLNMVHLMIVGTVDGTDPAKTTFSYTCPTVTLHSAVYFYQFSTSASSNKTWTTRFTITDSANDVVPPPQSTQPGGATIPWGVGTLYGASTSSTNGSTSAASTATSLTTIATTTPLDTTTVTTGTATSTPTKSPNGAVSTATASTLLWHMISALGISAFGFAVVF